MINRANGLGLALVALTAAGCASTADVTPEEEKPRVQVAKVEPDVGNYGRETDPERLFVQLNQQLRNARDPGTNVLAGKQLRAVLNRYVDANFDMIELALRKEHPGNRMIGAWSLGYSLDPRALPLLLSLLSDKDDRVRGNVLHAIALRGDPATPLGPLVACLGDKDLGVRRNATRAIRDVVRPGKGRQAIVPLTGLLSDVDAGVRVSAAAALGNIGLPECRGFLVNALRDSVPLVRGQAALSLGKVGDPKSVPALVTFLEAERNPVAMHSIMKSLATLTGQQFNTAVEWSAWLRSQQEG